MEKFVHEGMFYYKDWSDARSRDTGNKMLSNLFVCTTPHIPSQLPSAPQVKENCSTLLSVMAEFMI